MPGWGKRSSSLDDRNVRKRRREDMREHRQPQQEDQESKQSRRMPRRSSSLEGSSQRRNQARQRQMVRRHDDNTPRLQQFIGRQYPPEISTFRLGAMDKICQFCDALRFQQEDMNCCHKGKVLLPPLPDYPPELQQLFTSNSTQSRNFQDNIRQYNSSVAFASFGANMVTNPGRGPYAFRLHGQIYHRAGCLYPSDNTPPSYSQLYIIEANQAVQYRLQHGENKNCRQDVMTLLTTVLNQVNPYAVAYKHMQEVEQEQIQLAAENNTVPPVVTMNIMRGHDQRRYSDPTHAEEVAAVFVSPDGAPPEQRDIVVHPKDKAPRTISFRSANIDPMVYPVFFPKGTLGWTYGVAHANEQATKKRNKISCLQFYAHRLAVRGGFNPIFYGGKLFQQYVVDAYVRTEAGRLSWILDNQSNLRVDMYQGLMDHINTEAAEQNLAPGKIVILPSSFQGSPRAMQQNFQDAMTIVSKYGRPDLFLTHTCNPKCKDILDALPLGQRTENRPDIVARVFKRHLEELLHDIRKKHVLGVPVAFVYVIEFQKRGLPHCHLLIILADGSKLRVAADIDTIICAEIPDAVAQAELHSIVKTSMIHGPCGALNNKSPCMVDGKCSKDYPKDFQQNTALAVNGYPLYRRRDNGRTVVVGGHEVDNRWVVPYNPYLTKKYNAHINLEACTSIKSVKYLFKYVYKGHDCANIRVTETNQITHDEVHTFLDTRYVSAPEAFWRLSEYRLHEKSHSVYRLAIHLPNQQPVYFRQGHHIAATQEASRKDTMLTAYFKVNAIQQTPYLYTEFPHHYVWDRNRNSWTIRKQRGGQILPRIYSVSPKDSEKYCLRILLHHVPGATSFDYLRIVDGQTVDSFKEACILRHLLTDDREWDNAMREASQFQMPSQLRALFATICVYCVPTNARHLWESYKGAMLEDFVDFHHLTVHGAEQRALHHIESIFEQNGMTCSEFDLPHIDPVVFEQNYQNYDIAAEKQQAHVQLEMLNTDQRALVDRVLQDLVEIRHGEPAKCRAYFLDGPGGSGKTMCYNTLISYFRGQNEVVASSAWTGIAATLLKGGQTVHSLFKLPVPILDTSVCNVKPTSAHAIYLRAVSLFIIDEASMVPALALTAIDRMLRDITSKDVPFGGKIFLLGGDFRQVLPVIPRKPRAVIVENCLKRSPLWPHVTVFQLTKNMRAQNDQQDFSLWLLELGNGELRSELQLEDSIEIPPQCNIVQDDIVDEVFQDLSDSKSLADTVILTPTNEHALRMNDTVIQKMPGIPKIYTSADRVICDDEREANQYPLEFLNSITPTGMPQHRLTLKSGAIIMLLRNLDIKKGLCNGTRLVVRRLHSHVIDAEILTGTNKGDYVLIPRIKLAPSDVNVPFTLERTQFPVRVSYCVTINKSQGQTFDKLGIFLPSPVFAHGQLYVAFSRARCYKDISVMINQTPTQGLFQAKTITQNIVYKEVL